MRYVLKYFTDGGMYGTLRVGKWPKLPPTVPASVVTKRGDCNKIVDAVNAEIKATYPPDHDYRTETLRHKIFSIGDYYVVLFSTWLTAGWNPMWILDRKTRQVLWKAVA